MKKMFRLSTGLALVFLCLLLSDRGATADEWVNIRLNQDTTTELQNEEQIAINPTNPDNMVSVWRDFRLGYRQVGWAYTFDGGESWTEGGLFFEPNYPWQSDPGITADSDGNFYAIVLSYVSTSQPNGFYVFKSTDGGVSWGPSLEVIDGVPGVFEDKEFIACDRTAGPHAGNLYVVWTRFYDTEILFRRSTDSGQTWSSTITVGDETSTQFPIPVVGRFGQVYVAWSSYAHSSILFDTSFDGGQTFGTDQTVTSVYTPSTTLNGGVNAYSSPHMDADITNGLYAGRIYIAFMDRREGNSDRDIWVTTSDTGGLTWTTPVRVNDDPAGNGRDQFLPWLVVDNQGIVSVVFLDRRHDPQNRTYHCYVAQSYDGGVTWEPNMQVSTEPSDPNFAFCDLPVDTDAAENTECDTPTPLMFLDRAGLLGEYIGITAWDGKMTPIWTDIRNLHQDAYAGYLPGGSGIPEYDPTSIPFLAVHPNPARLESGVDLRLDLHEASPLGQRPTVVRILDLGGRTIRTLEVGRPGSVSTMPHGAATAHWDGRGSDGRRVAPGVYLLSTGAFTGATSGKIVLLD